MTTKREQAMRNAVASARMEGLPVSKQTERDCVRYLEGRIDTATLVQEILNRQRGQDREVKHGIYHACCLLYTSDAADE